MDALKRKLQAGIKGEVRFSEPMRRHTTFGTGGPADILVLPASVDDVLLVLKTTYEQGIPLFVMGSGSNLLVSDAGFPGVVMRLGHALGDVHVSSYRIRAEAGALLPKVAKMAARGGLTGLEWGGGVPGTVGGAVAMNAGAHGGETAGVLVSVTAVDRQGEGHELSPLSMGFGYRRSALVRENNLVVVEARFELGEENPDVVLETMKRYARRRRETQPLGMPSSGSVFKNPEGDFAGRLAEALGLKGFQIGGAAVSDVHGNFIVNKGDATSDDVRRIIDHVRNEVYNRFNIELETEVELVGWG